MQCPYCKLFNPSNAQRCDCGYDFQTGQVQKSYVSTDKRRGRPVGVGGWLLLFCLILTVLSPLKTIANLSSTYQEVSPLFGQFPRLRTVTILDFVLSAGVMSFSIYAGASLWRKKQDAVRTAKQYLVVFLLYTAVASLLPFMVGFPSVVNHEIFPEIIKGYFQSFLFFAIWITYLTNSRRVINTFSVS